MRSTYVKHLRMAPRSVWSTLDTVTGHAACGPHERSRTNGIDVWRWGGCRGGGSVEAQIVPDAGHGWADVGGAPRALAWLLPRLSLRD
jgi:poly(3-hydroxybutyrate) depolymerase